VVEREFGVEGDLAVATPDPSGIEVVPFQVADAMGVDAAQAGPQEHVRGANGMVPGCAGRFEHSNREATQTRDVNALVVHSVLPEEVCGWGGPTSYSQPARSPRREVQVSFAETRCPG
jgi:hypothetical protein